MKKHYKVEQELLMKTNYIFLKLGLLVVLVMIFTGCATQGKTVQRNSDARYSALKGGGTYGDTEAIASGGVENNQAAHVKAQQALSQSDFDRALYYYVKALEFNSKDIPALLALARIHTILKNLEPTILAYRLILESEPNNIEAMEGAGLTLLKINKAKQALVMLEKVNALSPGRAMTLMGLAVYYDLNADFDSAIQYYQSAAKAAPNSVKILNNYAYSRYLAGDWEEAENIYKKLLRQSPNHIQGVLNYGLLQARKGDATEALQTFKKVLSASEAYNELGYIYMMQKNYDTAKRMFELAISFSPTYFEVASNNLERLKLLVSKFTKIKKINKNVQDNHKKKDNLTIDKESLNTILSKWVQFYKRGNLEKYLSLFFIDADINGAIGREAIRKDYVGLFSKNIQRNISIDNLSWEIYENQGVGVGNYEAHIISNGEKSEKVIKGTVNITISIINEMLLITKMYHHEKAS